MAYTENRAYLELHLAVFLWGFTAVLGDVISLNAVTLVWWRVLLTSISLLAFVRAGKVIKEVGRKQAEKEEVGLSQVLKLSE